MLAIPTCFACAIRLSRLVRWIGDAIVSVGAPVQITSEVLRIMENGRIALSGASAALLKDAKIVDAYLGG